MLFLTTPMWFLWIDYWQFDVSLKNEPHIGYRISCAIRNIFVIFQSCKTVSLSHSLLSRVFKWLTLGSASLWKWLIWQNVFLLSLHIFYVAMCTGIFCLLSFFSLWQNGNWTACFTNLSHSVDLRTRYLSFSLLFRITCTFSPITTMHNYGLLLHLQLLLSVLNISISITLLYS